jgi:hypothetical protein
MFSPNNPNGKPSRPGVMLLYRIFGTMVGIVLTSSVSLTGTTLILINYQSQNPPCSVPQNSD